MLFIVHEVYSESRLTQSFKKQMFFYIIDEAFELVIVWVGNVSLTRCYLLRKVVIKSKFCRKVFYMLMIKI